MSKSLLFLINIYLIFLLFNSINGTVVVKASDDIMVGCQRNIYYILISVFFSEKPPKEFYSFTLNFDNPEDLTFKCMLDYSKSKIYCFRSFSDEVDMIEKNVFFQFPYPFPVIEDIEWDYDTFLQNIYRRVWNTKEECGNQNIFNETDLDYKNWDFEGKLISLSNGQCKAASLTNEEEHNYYFDMLISLTGGEIAQKLKDKKNNDQIELLQEIWIPLLPSVEKREKEKTYEREFPFAYCHTSEKISNKNYQNLKLNCHIPIDFMSIFNGEIKMNSFFDKVYIKNGDKTEISTIFININGTDGKTYASYSDRDQGIICPNQPVFTIDDKNNIYMGLYYNETNKYTFFLKGTLNNGYYSFKNGTAVELNETYKDLQFNLIVQDNFIESDEKEVTVSCTLPNGSPFKKKNEAVIKCIGSKEKKSNQNNNVDIVLNWNIKANNNFNNLIINWPRSYDDLNRKNIYTYELIGLSIRQTNYGCHNNNFDFYVYIYDLIKEPKLSFDLPLMSPKNTISNCQLFDNLALKCSINLKHKKISKGTKVMLPEKGSRSEINTEEGNRIIFTMNNYSQINNDHDNYVKTQEKCGDYLVVGTLKDMGMSHNTSMIVYIIVIVIILLIIIGFILYIGWKVRLRIKRGTKLTDSEQGKEHSTTVGINMI